MARVFVYGGWLPKGGALMAFEVAALLAKKVDAEIFVIQALKEAKPSDIFNYSVEASLVTSDQFLAMDTSADFLILNPSFQRPYFSLTVKSTIVSYLQGYSTYPYLDLGINNFVSVSEFVQKAVKSLYGVSSEVISPFIPPVETPLQYSQKNLSIAISNKGFPATNNTLLKWLKDELQDEVSFTDIQQTSRKRLLNEVNQHKFFLSLAISEGFGLMPIEAMALRTIPLGLDGYGGRDYMEFGKNSYCLPQNQLEELPALIRSVINKDVTNVSERAELTAQKYSYQRFSDSWNNYFDNTVLS